MYELSDHSYYPIGASKEASNRLFGMYHSGTSDHNKDVISKSMSVPEGIVRVVFATVALGMGVNLAGLNTVIHYGAPRSLENYFQECGRAGRSGEQAFSIIYWSPSDAPRCKETNTHQKQVIVLARNYLENSQSCRRSQLLQYFVGEQYKHIASLFLCCDVCKM